MSEQAAGSFLVVCSANQCRSPLAAAILQAHCDALDLDVAVGSAGVSAGPGIPATPATIEAARARGLDLTAHRSRELTSGMVAGADLVIAMERRHVQEVVLVDPSAFARTFTLKELVRRGNDIGGRAAGESLAEWLARVHTGRRSIDLLGMSTDDDIADPTGSALADHRSTADEIDHLVTALLGLLLPDDERSTV